MGVIAAGKIRAADRSLKESVAGDDAVGLGNVEADAGGGVAWSLESLQFVAADFQNVAFRKRVFNVGHLYGRKTKKSGLLADGFVERDFAGVHVSFDAEGGFRLGKCADMVQVGVGDQDGLDLYLQLVDGGKNDARFIAGIDQKGFARVLVGENAAILLEVKPHRDYLVNHTL